MYYPLKSCVYPLYLMFSKLYKQSVILLYNTCYDHCIVNNDNLTNIDLHD